MRNRWARANISARVASLQSLKLDVFALQGLKPAADLRCHVLLEARGVYSGDVKPENLRLDQKRTSSIDNG